LRVGKEEAPSGASLFALGRGKGQKEPDSVGFFGKRGGITGGAQLNILRKGESMKHREGKNQPRKFHEKEVRKKRGNRNAQLALDEL